MHDFFAHRRDHAQRVVFCSLGQYPNLRKNVAFLGRLFNCVFHVFGLVGNIFAVSVFAPSLKGLTQVIGSVAHIATRGKGSAACVVLQQLAKALCARGNHLTNNVGGADVGGRLVVSKAQGAADHVAHRVKFASVNVDVAVLLAVVNVFSASRFATQEATACASYIVRRHQVDAVLCVG